jgi:hypothetical protein
MTFDARGAAERLAPLVGCDPEYVDYLVGALKGAYAAGLERALAVADAFTDDSEADGWKRATRLIAHAIGAERERAGKP